MVNWHINVDVFCSCKSEQWKCLEWKTKNFKRMKTKTWVFSSLQLQNHIHASKIKARQHFLVCCDHNSIKAASFFPPYSLLVLSKALSNFLHLVDTFSTFQQLKKKRETPDNFPTTVFVCKPVSCCCPTYSVAASFTETAGLKSCGAALGHIKEQRLYALHICIKKIVRLKTGLDFLEYYPTQTIQ